MNLASIQKRLPIIAVILIIVVITLVIGSFIFRIGPPREADFRATSITPENQTLLEPNQPLQFTVFFSKEITPEDVIVSLQAQDVTTSDSPRNIETKVEKKDVFQLLIAASEQSLPYIQYRLNITDKNGAPLISAGYSTENPQPSPVPNNNLNLVRFLPHKTDNYSLSYDRELNLYISSFLYNPGSQDEISVQFEKAKNDAQQFMRQNGVDPNSVIVDWRYR